MAPDEFFQTYRDEQEPLEDIHYFQVTLRQPVDDRWSDWHGRLVDEAEQCVAYTNTWGVLAPDEKRAGLIAMQWQQRAYKLPPQIVEVNTDDTASYRDFPGVVWQSFREWESDRA